MAKNSFICPKCGKYMRIAPRDRIAMICDKDSFKEIAGNITSKDFIAFPGYADKLKKAMDQTGENEAVVCGQAKIGGRKCVIFVMDSRFIMASMGSVVGERITRAFEYATENRLPIIGFTASGGARMQEGIVSLMQMAKTSGAAKRHANGSNLYVTVLTDPTTGGVTASFAMLGDIIFAEPKALVGFAPEEELSNRRQNPSFLIISRARNFCLTTDLSIISLTDGNSEKCLSARLHCTTEGVKSNDSI